MNVRSSPIHYAGAPFRRREPDCIWAPCPAHTGRAARDDHWRNLAEEQPKADRMGRQDDESTTAAM